MTTIYLQDRPITCGMCAKCAAAPDCDHKCQGMIMCHQYERPKSDDTHDSSK